MSTPEAAPPVAAADATVAPAVVPVAPVAISATDPEPSWLKARLDREREAGVKAALRDLGIDNPSDAKAALADHRAKQEAAKSEATKQAERIAALEPAAKRAAEIEAEIAAEMADELAALDDAKRTAIKAAAGDDPVAQRRVLRALRPTWAAPVANAAPAAAAAKPPIAAPASTTAAAPAPAPAAPASENVLATYDALAKSNPMAAAAYRLANWHAYQAANKARG